MKSKIQSMQDMIVQYELNISSKDSMLGCYKEKMEEIQQKCSSSENIRKKQKDLLRRKEEEIMFLIDNMKKVKDEQMTLMEKHNELLVKYNQALNSTKMKEKQKE